MTEAAAATISFVQLDSTIFQYTVTLKDTGTTTLGSFWLGWVPGQFFLPDAPLTEGAPTGWTASPFSNSIQFIANTSASYVQAGGTLTGFTFTSNDSPAAILGDSPSAPGTPVLTSVAYHAGIENDPGFTFVVACFCAGTRILTAAGEIPVEQLAVGEWVTTLSRQRLAPVRWLGHRAIDCRRHPRPDDVWPVRVHAGAFGPGRPARDLRLSPDHAVYFDGVLIPVRYLVNGATIVQEAVDRVEYWHVELPAHDVLLAEGLTVESYLDTGNRCAFANGGPALLAHPDFALNVWATDACAPLVLDRPALAAAKRKLLARAAALGHAQTADPALHLCIDGSVLLPQIDGPVHRFTLPEGTREARLMSRSAVPAHLSADSDDHRRLGVAVARLTLDGAVIELGGGNGWFPAEDGWCWTDGAAALPCPGGRRLEVTVLPLTRYWADGARPSPGLAKGNAP